MRVQFYSVGENGVLYEIKKLNFNKAKVFLIDDIKNIYIWMGNESSDKKQRFAERRAKELNEKRDKPSNISIIHQGEEYGPFLAIMELLKHGMKESNAEFKRPELKIRYEDTLELVEAGIEPDFEGEITLAAQAEKLKKLSYEELCSKLAKIQLKIIKGNAKITEKEIEEKSREILKSSSTYDELCWLIAELTDLSKKKAF